MKVYLVGGAVRDKLLGVPSSDNDWVVVGATPQMMLDQGFLPVGKDFPVFIHPQTKEEYALARKEQKTGEGYTGFSFEAAPNISLQDDLLRRDLTINAMALDNEDQLIDPYGGQKDLQARRLRHVSGAFSEDPLRVLRVARFLGRFSSLGFSIDDNTFALMKIMSKQGELLAISPDRIWVELSKGLIEVSPQTFMHCLYDCGALQSLLPELHAVYKQVVPRSQHVDSTKAQGDASHPASQVIEKALSYAAKNKLSIMVRWAIVCHGLDADVAEEISLRLKAPKQVVRLAVLASRQLRSVLTIQQLSAEDILVLLESCDAFRESTLLEPLVQLAEAMMACELHSDEQEQAKQLQAIINLLVYKKACMAVSAQQFVEKGLQGKQIAQAIKQARILSIQHLLDMEL